MPAYGALSDASGTVATGGTAQTALTPTQPLRYLLVVNQSTHPLYIDFGTAATTASIPLKACSSAGDGTGGSWEWKGSSGDDGFVPGGFLSVYGGTSSQAFTIKYG